MVCSGGLGVCPEPFRNLVVVVCALSISVCRAGVAVGHEFVDHSMLSPSLQRLYGGRTARWHLLCKLELCWQQQMQVGSCKMRRRYTAETMALGGCAKSEAKASINQSSTPTSRFLCLVRHGTPHLPPPPTRTHRPAQLSWFAVRDSA